MTVAMEIKSQRKRIPTPVLWLESPLGFVIEELFLVVLSCSFYLDAMFSQDLYKQSLGTVADSVSQEYG